MASTGDSLSVLGYGCMRLPEKNGRIDEERAERQIHSAIEAGVNYFDTALLYHMGNSEPFLGKLLAGGLRQKLKLATKLPPDSVRRRDDMEAILDKQLKSLRSDRIDYYLLHGLQERSWKKFLELGALDFLERAKADGRIVNAGFSFHGGREVFKEIVDAYGWQFCQIQYNYFDQDLQAGPSGLDYAAAKGLGIIIMEPLMGGLLAGDPPAAVREIWERAPVRRSPAEWSLRWLWNRPEIQVVLSGMNDERHIEENIRIAGQAEPGSLSEAELALVEEARRAYNAALAVGCTGCRYCLPCPSGVDIPTCFELLNRVKTFGESKMDNLARYALRLGWFDGAKRGASRCTVCGKCSMKCPQKLAIPEQLKVVRKEFETLGLRLFSLGGKIFFARLR